MPGTINLMALRPRADVPTKIYTVGMPDELRTALYDLFEPMERWYKLNGYDGLRASMRRWLDQAVELHSLRGDEPCPEWLVALRPVDLRRLCNVTAAWADASCPTRQRNTEAYRKVMALLVPRTFEGCTAERDLRLFDDEGRPAEGRDWLAFSAFSAQVANSLVGKTLRLADGTALELSRLAGGTDNSYELLSDVRFYRGGQPYAIGLRFHVETLPTGRQARVYVDAVVHRFINEARQKNPYLQQDVHPYVLDGDHTYRVMGYGYVSGRGVDWDAQARANFEKASGRRLPDMGEYLAHMDEYARGKNGLRILSPQSARTSGWAKDSQVEPGASVVDKANIFQAVADALAGFAAPADPLTSVPLANLPLAHEGRGEDHDAWARSNRRRLAECTGEHRLKIQVLCSALDRGRFGRVRDEVVSFLGEEGDRDGLDLSVELVECDRLLAPLGGTRSQDERFRWAQIRGTLGTASGLVACIVLLPGGDDPAWRDVDEEGSQRSRKSRDPKEAIRMGLARTGRLSQFLVPADEPGGDGEGAGFEKRARVAVRDLMRQTGFVYELRDGGRGIDPSRTAVGLTIYQSPRAKKKVQFPIAVWEEPKAGRVKVECPLWEGPLPYWRAELRLAQISTGDGEGLLGRIGGQSLKRMLDNIHARAATGEIMLLVHAYGAIRYKSWWPGISDTGLADGTLRYGPGCDAMRPEGFPLDEPNLIVLRVRSGADGEVPDYYTDAKDDEGENGTARYYGRQGLFPMGKVVYGLAPKPGNNKSYGLSTKRSKFDRPGQRFNERTLNEYFLLTPGDDKKLIACARYAEALRGGMVQLLNTSMRVNMPGPLHLAECLGEYVWAPDKRDGRKA